MADMTTSSSYGSHLRCSVTRWNAPPQPPALVQSSLPCLSQMQFYRHGTVARQSLRGVVSCVSIALPTPVTLTQQTPQGLAGFGERGSESAGSMTKQIIRHIKFYHRINHIECC